MPPTIARSGSCRRKIIKLLVTVSIRVGPGNFLPSHVMFHLRELMLTVTTYNVNGACNGQLCTTGGCAVCCPTFHATFRDSFTWISWHFMAKLNGHFKRSWAIFVTLIRSSWKSFFPSCSLARDSQAKFLGKCFQPTTKSTANMRFHQVA